MMYSEIVLPKPLSGKKVAKMIARAAKEAGLEADIERLKVKEMLPSPGYEENTGSGGWIRKTTQYNVKVRTNDLSKTIYSTTTMGDQRYSNLPISYRGLSGKYRAMLSSFANQLIF